MRLNRIPVVIGALVWLAFRNVGFAADEKKDASNPAPFMTINLADEAGKPVAGAKVCFLPILRDYDSETGGKWSLIYEIESDSNGIARYPEVIPRLKVQPQIYARHGDRQLVGVGDFKVEDFSQGVRLTMPPECHVSVKLDSVELEQVGRKIERPQGIFGQAMKSRFWCYPGADNIAHAFLPPGEYVFAGSSPTCSEMSMSFEIKPGHRELDLGTLDLPANPLVLLEGKPAPELEDVIKWKNGPGPALSELRGKVVLLEFWGWWCGPGLQRGIPELFKLQEEFRGKDLVIIGVHIADDETDEINTIAKLDDKLSQVRETVWKGKDIGFPVALTQFHKGRYSERGPEYAPSKTCAKYGIFSYPSAVLIGKDGNVIGKCDPSKPEDREKLKRLLDATSSK